MAKICANFLLTKLLADGIMVNSGAGNRQRAAEKSIGNLHKKQKTPYRVLLSETKYFAL